MYVCMYVWMVLFSHVMGLALCSCFAYAHMQDFVLFKVPGVDWGNKSSLSLQSRHPSCIKNLETHVAYLGANGFARYINSSCIMGWHLCLHPHVGLSSDEVIVVRILVMVHLCGSDIELLMEKN
jgi:hypothetical protein